MQYDPATDPCKRRQDPAAGMQLPTRGWSNEARDDDRQRQIVDRGRQQRDARVINGMHTL